MSKLDVTNGFEANKKRFIDTGVNFAAFLRKEGLGTEAASLSYTMDLLVECITNYPKDNFHNGKATYALSSIANEIEKTLKSLSEKAETNSLDVNEVKTQIAFLNQQIMEKREELELAKVASSAEQFKSIINSDILYEALKTSPSAWSSMLRRINPAIKPVDNSSKTSNRASELEEMLSDIRLDTSSVVNILDEKQLKELSGGFDDVHDKFYNAIISHYSTYLLKKPENEAQIFDATKATIEGFGEYSKQAAKDVGGIIESEEPEKCKSKIEEVMRNYNEQLIGLVVNLQDRTKEFTKTTGHSH